AAPDGRGEIRADHGVSRGQRGGGRERVELRAGPAVWYAGRPADPDPGRTVRRGAAAGGARDVWTRAARTCGPWRGAAPRRPRRIGQWTWRPLDKAPLPRARRCGTGRDAAAR